MTKYRIAFLLFLTITIQPFFGQVTTKTVNVSTPGSLSTLINTTDASTITTLTLSGNIDARDFVFMRDNITHLAALDISTARIKAYTGIDGTYAGTSITYSADEIPLCAFYNAISYTYKGTLTSIKLPTTITSIGGSAFYYCYALAGTFTIPASVKSIGDYALYGCSQLSAYSVETANTRYSSNNGVLFNKKQDTLFICPSAKTGAYTIPSTVVCIANSAFDGCGGLTGTLTIPTSVKAIGSYAFYYCYGFKGALTLPNEITYIGDGAFYGCSSLKGIVTLPKSVAYIGYYPFFGCDSISSYQIDPTNSYYSTLNDALFTKKQDTLLICPSYKSGVYAMPSTVKGIGSYAFYNCSHLTGGLAIPKSVSYIGSYAFYGTNQISSFDVDPANTVYMSNAGVLFTKKQDSLLVCPAGKIGSYAIPNTVTAVGTSAFYNCTNLTGSLSIPSSVKSIGSYAFYGCNQVASYDVESANTKYSSLDGVLFDKAQDSLWICPAAKSGSYVVPSSVKHIGTYSFYYCTALTGSISLPASLNTIGDYAFYGCSNLTAFNVDVANKYYSSVDGALLNQVKDSLFICPAGKTGSYTIPTTVVAIDYSAFSECIGLTTIELPSSLKSIGASAFYYCSGLTEIYLPKNLSTIGSGAFYGCYNLQKFGIQNPTPPTIDAYTFLYVNQSSCQLLVPIGSLATYQSKLYWKNFTLASESNFLGIASAKNDGIRVYSNHQNIVVEGLKEGEPITLYTTNGQIAFFAKAGSNRMLLPAQKGIHYLVKTKNNSVKVVL